MIIALIGLCFTAIGLIVSIVLMTRKMRAEEISAAVNRGKMEQRMLEVEDNVDHLGVKVRKVAKAQEEFNSVLIELRVGQTYIIKTLDELRCEHKGHVAEHNRGTPE